MTATPDERLCRRRGGNCVCQQAAECIFEASKSGMTETWKRHRVWWFTRLQNGGLAWPGTLVEYEEITIPIAAWMIGSPMRFTKYRALAVLKGK